MQHYEKQFESYLVGPLAMRRVVIKGGFTFATEAFSKKLLINWNIAFRLDFEVRGFYPNIKFSDLAKCILICL